VTLAPRNYVRALQKAGAIRARAAAGRGRVDDPDLLLDRVDALLLAGGAEIDPASYGAEPHPETKGPGRSATARAGADPRALERDMPVLGSAAGCS